MRDAMRDAGFTLIEVLAALVIFSVAIIGLTHAGTESTRAVSVLQEKMLAGVIADNQIVLARSQPLKIGSQFGEASAMSRVYEYNLVTRKTETHNFYEIKIKVNLKDSEQTLIERTAYRKGQS